MFVTEHVVDSIMQLFVQYNFIPNQFTKSIFELDLYKISISQQLVIQEVKMSEPVPRPMRASLALTSLNNNSKGIKTCGYEVKDDRNYQGT